MSDLTLVVVAKNHADLRAFDLTHVDARETVLVANLERIPLSVIGNHYLDHARTSVVGLVHADCLFGAGALETFAQTAVSGPDGAVCGLVGIDLNSTYRWSKDNPGAVSTLDSCSVFLRSDAGLRFDEQLCDSLHLHVEDLCLQALTAGIPVLVPAAQADHLSKVINGPRWREEYYRYYARLRAKWANCSFKTT